MAFVTPEYSKADVNRAGLILARNPQIFNGEWLGATSVLANWRAAHAYPINTFQATLRARLKKVAPEALVAQRLKRTPSIIAKLQRFKGMQLARMQDIGGLRAVVSTTQELRYLFEIYQTAYLSHQLISVKDYMSAPKFDGYRSIHLIYRYNSVNIVDYDGLSLELQLRTKLQHARATAVETMGIYLGQALKSGQGEDEWKQFFKTASAALAHIEKAEPVPGYEGFDRKTVYKQLMEEEANLDVVTKLRSFAVATENIHTLRGTGSYHLIVLNLSDRSVAITPYATTRLEQANRDYALVEEKAKSGEPLEAVLVSAGSVDALKKAYPNYFLDTQVFINQIERIIQAAKR